MGVCVNWSSTAERDLDDLEAYISAENPGAADSFCSQLVRRTDQLEEFPELGSVVSEFRNLGVRQLVHGSYRIFYRFDKAKREVEIVRVWHGARGTPRLR